MRLDSDLGPIFTGVIDFTTRIITDHFLLVYGSLIGHAYVDINDPITKRKIVESAVERLVSEFGLLILQMGSIVLIFIL